MNTTMLGGGSPLNKFKAIDKHLSRNSRTVHVERSGDNIKGNGSSAKPYATLERALKDAAGTTSILKIDLGAGAHVLNGQTSINSVNVHIVGDGAIELDSKGEYAFLLTNAMLTTEVNINDVSSRSYKALAVLDAGSIFAVRARKITLVNCFFQMFINGIGHNGFLVANSTITSSRAIKKVAVSVNSAPVSEYVVNATLTNLT